MEIYFFSDNKSTIKKIKDLKEKKKRKVSIYNICELKKICRNIRNRLLVYLDIGNYEAGYMKDVKYLAKKDNIYFGIIDLKGKEKDVAQLFFAGAVDYIRRIDPQDGIDDKRFSMVFLYIKKYRSDFTHEIKEETKTTVKKTQYKSIQNGWAGVESGNEYAFSIMFIELDGEKELEKKYGRKNFKKALSTFINYIKKQINSFQGRIWFWSSAGGVVLFPFDGASCPAVLCGFRLKLYKHLYDVEESLFPLSISFRIALHIGNVTYFTDDTGEIISETINSVFHLGKNFAKPDNFCITDEVYSLTPVQLKDFFIKMGVFEGRTIMRMKEHRFGE